VDLVYCFLDAALFQSRGNEFSCEKDFTLRLSFSEKDRIEHFVCIKFAMVILKNFPLIFFKNIFINTFPKNFGFTLKMVTFFLSELNLAKFKKTQKIYLKKAKMAVYL